MATTTLTHTSSSSAYSTTMTSFFGTHQQQQHQHKDRPSTPTRSRTWPSPPPRKRPSITSSPSSSRPHSRSSSVYSTAWYTADESQHSLEKIAERLNTYAARFERFLGLCATNIVMALFRPTPLVIFLFHPLFMILWAALAAWWVVGWAVS